MDRSSTETPDALVRLWNVKGYGYVEGRLLFANKKSGRMKPAYLYVYWTRLD